MEIVRRGVFQPEPNSPFVTQGEMAGNRDGGNSRQTREPGEQFLLYCHALDGIGIAWRVKDGAHHECPVGIEA